MKYQEAKEKVKTNCLAEVKVETVCNNLEVTAHDDGTVSIEYETK